MLCKKCGNQVDEGKILCLCCGTIVDGADYPEIKLDFEDNLFVDVYYGPDYYIDQKSDDSVELILEADYLDPDNFDNNVGKEGL